MEAPIRLLRELAELQQQVLAAELEISKPLMSQIERGERDLIPTRYAQLAEMLALGGNGRRPVYWATAFASYGPRGDHRVELLGGDDGRIGIFAFDDQHLAVAAADAIGAVVGIVYVVPTTKEYARAQGKLNIIDSAKPHYKRTAIAFGDYVSSAIRAWTEIPDPEPVGTTTTTKRPKNATKKAARPAQVSGGVRRP